MKKPLLFPNSAINSLSKLAFTLLLSIFLAFQAAATDYFVDASKATTNDVASGGLTWETAFKTVPFALSVADGTGVTNRIFVKQGTHIMTATAYTFINSSLTLQGGFPTAAAGTDISGYSAANLTTLDYNLLIPTTGTIVIQNTGAGPYTVDIKGFTQVKLNSTTVYSIFFSAISAGTANTTFNFTDMKHDLGVATATGTQGFVKTTYDLENLTSSNSVTFTNCYFGDIYGGQPAFGAAITVRSSAIAPTLTTCTFDGPSNAGTGGIIFLEKITASPVINVATDNKFINTANSPRYGNHFTLYNNTGDFIIDGLTNPIDNNRAGASFPGAFVRAWGAANGTSTGTPVGVVNVGKIIIKNCTFTNTTEGGVINIHSYGGRGDIEITNNIFTNNKNTYAFGSGGIYIQGVPNTLVTTDIPNVTISNNTFTGNAATAAFGGAISSFGAGVLRLYKNYNITNNTFNANTASDGGAVYIMQAVPLALNITGNTFTDNLGTLQGGAISLKSVNVVQNVANNTFCGNKVTNANGGAIYANNANIIPVGTDYPLNINNNIFYDNRSQSAGSAIYGIDLTSAHVNKCTFTLNDGGGSGTIFFSDFDIASDIDSCVFVKNVNQGATLTMSQAKVNLKITKCNFTDNASTGNQAAAIGLNITAGISSLVEDCLFDGNSDLIGAGGAIYSSSSTVADVLSINRCIFKNNYIGNNPLINDVEDSDVSLSVATVPQAKITNSYLQSPLVTTNYVASNIAPAANNVQISSINTFNKTVPNGCAAVPLVFQLNAAVTPPAGTIDCAKTQISPAPVAGTPSQVDLIVTINVTTAGTFSPITVSGSGITLANGVTSITATTTGIQQFHIPIKYDGSALGTLNFQIGTLTACTANLSLAPKSVISPIWTLDNCTPQVGPVLK